MEDVNYKTLLGILIRSMTFDYERNKTINHATRLVVGTTPQVLVNLGFPQLPLIIDGSVIDKAYFDHGIPKSKLEKLCSLIAVPKAVYAAHQGNPGSVIVTYEIKDAKPIVIPIHPNRPKARNEFFNVIASVYPKASNNNESIEIRWKKEGLLLWEAPPKKAS